MPARSPIPLIGALDLSGAGGDACKRVRSRQAEVVVAVDGEGHAGQLGAVRLDLAEERGVLRRQGVADRVGQVDGRCAGADRGAAHGPEEVRVRTGRVLGRELDLVDAAPGVRDRGHGLLEHLGRLEVELPFHVDRAGGDNDVETGASCVGERFDGRVDVLERGAGERGDGGVLDGLGDGPDAFEVAGRRDREASLDHVDAEALELGGDLDLLVWLQRDARRLLAVAKGCVEDRDPAGRQLDSSSSGLQSEAHLSCGEVGVCAYEARGRKLPLEGENHDEKNRDQAERSQ